MPATTVSAATATITDPVVSNATVFAPVPIATTTVVAANDAITVPNVAAR